MFWCVCVCAHSDTDGREHWDVSEKIDLGQINNHEEKARIEELEHENAQLMEQNKSLQEMNRELQVMLYVFLTY